MIKKVVALLLCFCMMLSFSACGKNKEESTTEQTTFNGSVDSPEEFRKLGMLIDVDKNNSNIKNVSYSIERDDVAAVSFEYNGLECEFKASTTKEEYDLANIVNTCTGDMISTEVKGLSAGIYSLVPGRVVFFKDTQIKYSLYIWVTCLDSVVYDIVDTLIFENHYDESIVVSKDRDNESEVFAQKVVEVIKSRDKEALGEIMLFPQQLGTGESVANKEEFNELSDSVIFTDILVRAMEDETVLDNLRTYVDDDTEYVIGTNYKNVHFKLDENREFKIIKINN